MHVWGIFLYAHTHLRIAGKPIQLVFGLEISYEDKKQERIVFSMDIHDVSIMSFLIYKQTHPNTYKCVLLTLQTNTLMNMAGYHRLHPNVSKANRRHRPNLWDTDTHLKWTRNRLEFEHRWMRFGASSSKAGGGGRCPHGYASRQLCDTLSFSAHASGSMTAMSIVDETRKNWILPFFSLF